jgi:hypothetical protein
MRIYIILTALILSCAPSANANDLSIDGRIKKVITAEMDPFVVGETCIIIVSTSEKKTVLLQTDFEKCNDNSDELYEGRGLSVYLDETNVIVDPDVLSILSEIQADSYFKTDFEYIENGLHD